MASTDDTSIYTDGSGINSRVGAAAVSKVLGYKSVPLGPLGWSTVYFAEMIAIGFALGMLLIHDESVGIWANPYLVSLANSLYSLISVHRELVDVNIT